MPQSAQDFGSAIDHLLPERHPQIDYSICDVAEAVLKDLVPSMEHPFYALSKKPDMSIRRYEHGPNWVEIIPSAKGQATIYDKDILKMQNFQITVDGEIKKLKTELGIQS